MLYEYVESVGVVEKDALASAVAPDGVIFTTWPAERQQWAHGTWGTTLFDSAFGQLEVQGNVSRLGGRDDHVDRAGAATSERRTAMTFTEVLKTFYRRVRNHQSTTYWGFRGEVAYAARQARATCYQKLHILADRTSRGPLETIGTAGCPAHTDVDYLDPSGENDYHVVVSCMCGKEWS